MSILGLFDSFYQAQKMVNSGRLFQEKGAGWRRSECQSRFLSFLRTKLGGEYIVFTMLKIVGEHLYTILI